ncbi:MAG: hypothetical protein V2A65_09340 [Candidatus Omnitrophota bacterium]
MHLIKRKKVWGGGMMAILLFLGICGWAFGESITPEDLVHQITERWVNTENLQADLTVGTTMSGTPMNVDGTYWQKGRLFRIEVDLPSSSAGNEDKPGEPNKGLCIFDGKTLWLSSPDSIFKINYSVLGNEIKGIALPKIIGNIPAVSYQLSEKTLQEIEYYLLETRDVGQFIQEMVVPGMNFSIPVPLPFQRVVVWVNKTSLFPEMFEFYAKGENPSAFLRFGTINPEPAFSPELFTFKVTKGGAVMDVTELVKDQLKGFSDTP